MAAAGSETEVMSTISGCGASTDTLVAKNVVPLNENVALLASARDIYFTVNDALPRTISPTASWTDDDSQVADENVRLSGPPITIAPVAL